MDSTLFGKHIDIQNDLTNTQYSIPNTRRKKLCTVALQNGGTSRRWSLCVTALAPLSMTPAAMVTWTVCALVWLKPASAAANRSAAHVAPKSMSITVGKPAGSAAGEGADQKLCINCVSKLKKTVVLRSPLHRACWPPVAQIVFFERYAHRMDGWTGLATASRR